MFLDRIRRLTEHARSLAGQPDPGQAFFDCLTHMVTEGRTKRDLIDAMSGAGIDVTAPSSPASHDLRSARPARHRQQLAAAGAGRTPHGRRSPAPPPAVWASHRSPSDQWDAHTTTGRDSRPLTHRDAGGLSGRQAAR